MIDHSAVLFKKAKNYIPGGVNSPARSFQAVGSFAPRFIKKAQGQYLWDADNNRFIDYVCSWGLAILGHSHPAVVKAVYAAVENGLSFGAPCENEVKLAAAIHEFIPSVEKVRMVNSGTEATMSALRLARGFTKKDKIIKFEGCYHGHADSLLVKSGSGALTFGSPTSPGIPIGATQDTLIATFNDLNSVVSLFETFSYNIAAVIVEPIAGNMSLLPGTSEFLNGLRELCNHYESLLIFDEVITGFRVAKGGAQSLYKIKPDLTILGKIIGGGMPVGAYGGRREIMDHVSPQGPIYQAGTLSGNPIAMAAGLATLKELKKENFYSILKKKTEYLVSGILTLAQDKKIPLTINSCCGIFGLFFTTQEHITRYDQVVVCKKNLFRKFFHAMLNNGIYLAPSAFESGFLSSAHTNNDIEQTLKSVEKAFDISKS